MRPPSPDSVTPSTVLGASPRRVRRPPRSVYQRRPSGSCQCPHGVEAAGHLSDLEPRRSRRRATAGINPGPGPDLPDEGSAAGAVAGVGAVVGSGVDSTVVGVDGAGAGSTPTVVDGAGRAVRTANAGQRLAAGGSPRPSAPGQHRRRQHQDPDPCPYGAPPAAHQGEAMRLGPSTEIGISSFRQPSRHLAMRQPRDRSPRRCGWRRRGTAPRATGSAGPRCTRIAKCATPSG